MLAVRWRSTGLVVPALLMLCLPAAGTAAAELFPRPAGLEPAIAFWTDIYTTVPSGSGVLHDSRNLSVRYEVMELPEGASRRERARRIENRRQHYQSVLEALAAGKREGLSSEEARVLALWPEDVSERTLAQAARQIRFQLGQADRFRAGLVRSGAYRDYIARVLADRGLPAELAALPHVESSFDPTAYSKVGAAGMWQFMRSTGRRYMRVDHVVDERRDPFLSTVGAAKLLENNYAVTGSWPLALTGYNHGVAGMRRAVRKLGTDDIETIVRDYRSRTFGFASRNFYAAFLAALQIDRDPKKYFGDIRLDPPADDRLLTVEDYVSADGLARALGVETRVLRRHNPALQATVWSGSKHIPRGFTLRLPAQFAAEDPAILLARLDPSARFDRQLPDVTHRVARGDTLSAIAATYRVRESDLVALNGLRSRHQIRAGQVLRLPTAGQSAIVQVASAESAEPEPAAIVPARLELPPAPSAAGYDATLIAAAMMGPPRIDDESPVPIDGDELTTGLATAQAALAADPSDYAVGEDGTIEVQAMETLGHYADWLGIRTQRLRDINGFAFNRPVRIGERIRLDPGEADREAFESRRSAYHEALQEQFFTRYRIRDAVAHQVRRGESVWLLARRNYRVPLWLLRQYNPDLQLDRVRPGMRLQFPVLEEITEGAGTLRIAEAD